MAPAHKLGGVIHCFYGSKDLVQQYLDLGYHVGIGGSLLQQAERVKDLQEAVSYIPLDRILVETDSPFILPYCKDTLPPNTKYRLNSLIDTTSLTRCPFVPEAQKPSHNEYHLKYRMFHSIF